VNYAFIAFVDMSYRALQPVFFSTPVALGGLGLDPPVIGTVMSSYGIMYGIVTVFFFSPMTDYFGVKGVYMLGIFATVPCFSLFPIINHLAHISIERSGGLGTEVWVAVGLQVIMSVLVSLCFGTSAQRS
jgi:MFS family permease